MSGSTLPRRALGRMLRELRTGAGRSQLAAGLHIEVSKQTIGRVEDGQPARISTAQYRDLLDFYGADVETKEEVHSLLQEVKGAKGDLSGGWWRAYADLGRTHFDHFMSLEQACDRLTTCQYILLPGLLHTPAYRRWIEATTDPAMSGVEVQRRLELTARRQRRLVEDPEFSVDVLLSESAIRHQVGGRSVMAEQLRHLLEVGALPNVSIRVIPFESGGHPGLVVQSYTMFEFPPLANRRIQEPPVVFVEGFSGDLFLESESSIRRYRAATDALHAIALGRDETRRLVQDIEREYAA